MSYTFISKKALQQNSWALIDYVLSTTINNQYWTNMAILLYLLDLQKIQYTDKFLAKFLGVDMTEKTRKSYYNKGGGN